ncbi:GIDE domain-containing protein [Dyella ginsengisoli]|uniref:GIDE domain-containing protein n=1 Tax=Dyella ginsengisoli TaxID=363848 RepID=UPI000368174A|nr:GIDE domain-containing protein [Dyella ginsengisoli]
MEFHSYKAVADAVIGMTLFGALGAIGLVGWYRSLKRARMIEDVPTSRTRSAAQGHVELVGHQFAASGKALLAPLTGVPCTWWRYRIEQYKVDYTAPGRRHWVTLEQAVSSDPILIDDGKGRMLVDPRGAEVMPSVKDCWRNNQASLSRPMAVRNGRSGRFRYTEERMHEGETFYVIGELHSLRPSLTAGDASRDLLTQWKRDQAALIRRFDADGNGRIDSDEWDAAREAAQAEVRERLQAREQAAGVTMDTIRRPENGLPFLLASRQPVEMANKYRLYARNNLLLFIVCGAIELYLFLLTRHLFA